MPQTRSILVPRVLALKTDDEPEGSGVENEPSGQFPIVRYSAVDVDLPQVDLQNQELLERTLGKSTVDAR